MRTGENAKVDVQQGAATLILFVCRQALHLFTEATAARIDVAEVAAEFVYMTGRR